MPLHFRRGAVLIESSLTGRARWQGTSHTFGPSGQPPSRNEGAQIPDALGGVSDKFNGTLDAWSWSYGDISIVDERLVIPVDADYAGAIYPVGAGDGVSMDGTSTVIQVYALPPGSMTTPDTDAWLELFRIGSTVGRFAMGTSGGLLQTLKATTTETYGDSIEYDHETMKWWRIRKPGTGTSTVYFEYSADGSTWVELWSTSGINASDFMPQILAGVWGGSPETGEFVVESFNIGPE